MQFYSGITGARFSPVGLNEMKPDTTGWSTSRNEPAKRNSNDFLVADTPSIAGAVVSKDTTGVEL